MKISRLLLAAALLFISGPVLGQAVNPVTTQNASRATGNVSTTISVTNTFQSIATKNTNRMGCLVQNNGTNSMWVFFGPIADATKAKSAVLGATQALNCATSGISATDQISITGTSGDAFSAMIDGAPILNSPSTVTLSGGGGGAVSIADGADVTQGAIADAAVAAGAAGTVNAHLRTLTGQLPATIGQKAMAASLPVVIASDQASFPVTVAAGSAIIGNVRIDQTTPGTTNGVVATPTSATTGGVAPVVTATAASSKVLKGSAGNLYGFSCTSGASAGVCYVFDATALPSNGTVTPVDCVIVAATQTAAITYNPPLVMATGATVGFGTGTNCFSLTASATAFISGEAK